MDGCGSQGSTWPTRSGVSSCSPSSSCWYYDNGWFPCRNPFRRYDTRTYRSSYVADLTAGQVSAPGGPFGGSGMGNLLFDTRNGRVCFLLSWHEIDDPTEVTINRARAGDDGPEIVDLELPDNGEKACIRADRDDLKDIARNPTRYYLNVVNDNYPDGAIRGQLVRAYGD